LSRLLSLTHLSEARGVCSFARVVVQRQDHLRRTAIPLETRELMAEADAMTLAKHKAAKIAQMAARAHAGQPKSTKAADKSVTAEEFVRRQTADAAAVAANTASHPTA
jgi:hypothetical protein